MAERHDRDAAPTHPAARGILQWTVGRWEPATLPESTFAALFAILAEIWLAVHGEDAAAADRSLRDLQTLEKRIGVQVDLQRSLPDSVVIHEWLPRKQAAVWTILHGRKVFA